jgi:hypothetical protein
MGLVCRWKIEPDAGRLPAVERGVECHCAESDKRVAGFGAFNKTVRLSVFHLYIVMLSGLNFS